eukprot:COSAG02_NODE_251_length_27002_cov_13.799242_9_plen_106_part_00
MHHPMHYNAQQGMDTLQVHARSRRTPSTRPSRYVCVLVQPAADSSAETALSEQTRGQPAARRAGRARMHGRIPAARGGCIGNKRNLMRGETLQLAAIASCKWQRA